MLSLRRNDEFKTRNIFNPNGLVFFKLYVTIFCFKSDWLDEINLERR